MKIRGKNEPLRALIEKLKERQAVTKENVWGSIAEALNRPRRKSFEIELSKLDKYEGMVVVPGIVLGAGTVSKPMEVYAIRFTKPARAGIEKAGGKCRLMQDVLGLKVPSEIRIVV